jgi:hypothetical protein
MMKTLMLATAAMISFGVGSPHADNGDDGGTIANTFFTTLPGDRHRTGTAAKRSGRKPA